MIRPLRRFKKYGQTRTQPGVYHSRDERFEFERDGACRDHGHGGWGVTDGPNATDYDVELLRASGLYGQRFTRLRDAAAAVEAHLAVSGLPSGPGR